MTPKTLKDILTSKPRLRVARICAKWLAIFTLTPLKWALKVFARPFLILADFLYDLGLSMSREVGDIMGELAEEELRRMDEEGDDEIWEDE